MRILDVFSAARRASTAARSLPAIAAVCLLLAACGSSGPSTSSGNNSSKSSSGGSASTPASDTGSAATISTIKVPGYGTVLASKGSPLYMLSADPGGGSSCSGACAKQWQPLTAGAAPAAGAGVSAAMISRFKRSDGGEQVLYNGHALYTHPGASATAVAGTAAFGGIWYLVSPGGKPVKSTSGSGY